MRPPGTALSLLPLLLTATALAAPPPLGTVGAPRELTDAALDARRPRFSPDGQTLVFAGGGGQADIWAIGVDGQGLRQLTTDPGDDRHPAFTRDGSIVWSAERGGVRAMWIMGADGSDPRRLLALDGELREPAPSPIGWMFLAVNNDECTDTGATATVADRYEKIAFTRVVKGRSEVWWASPDGRHAGRVSPAGKECWGPAWSNNGLELTWACKDGPGAAVTDTRARWDLTFADALKAIGWDGETSKHGPGCEEGPDVAQWEADACLDKLPRRYARFEGAARSRASDGLGEPAYSQNRALLLASGRAGVRVRARDGAGAWAELLPAGATAAVWSPDGRRVAFQLAKEGRAVVAVADTGFYLQDVRDLADYPELLGKGASERLQTNGFVARRGAEREMYTLYEKVRYAGRAPFVTADAALQAFHDETTTLLRRAEEDAQGQLLALCDALLAHLTPKLEGGSPALRWTATVIGVGRTFLAAGEAIELPDPSELGLPVEDREPGPPLPLVQLPALARAQLEQLPAPLRADARRWVDALLAHEGLAKLPVPGEEPVQVDLSQAKPRGHYTTSRLAGWFVAMSWFAVAPLPLDAGTLELVDAMKTVRAGDGAALDGWRRLDAFVGGFMGRPVDVTPGHVAQLLAARPGAAGAFDRAAVAKELAALRGPVPFRGVGGALEGAEWPVRILLFPKRYGLDAEVFKRLTHPDVPLRAFPSAVDVLAALGVPRAMAAAQAGEDADAAVYRRELEALARENGGRPGAYWSTDIYHSWLALLRAVALPALPADRLPLFARTPAWHDRQLLSALAGYTQLKHAAVLYAYQEMGVECDSPRPVLAYIEQPDVGVPRGYVDPNPAAFAAMEALAGRVYAIFAGGEAPEVYGAATAGAREVPYDPAVGWPEEEPPERVADNVRKLAARLGRIAQQQLDGQALADADAEWLFRFGAVLEALFLRAGDGGDSGGRGQDAGRAARGVAIATDVYTNLQRQQALTLGIGRLLDLFVAVPDGVGRRLTQGALLSFHELRQPMGDRLTDEAWSRRLDAGEAPPLPAWAASFVE